MMPSYQLSLDGREEPIAAPQPRDSGQAQTEQSCLFEFPETMPGQLALPDEKRDCDA